MLTHGSLFSGIGGFDLGFSRVGIKTIWQVENDPYAIKVLEKHWPEVTRYQDIKEIEWENVEVPDIVSGGFPCQPVSVAGKRKGTDDERWLWPEFVRCLRVLRPRYVVLENVPGLLAIGFGDVLGDLATLGYDAEWDSIPVAAFGAPHLRYRVWVVGYAQRRGRASQGVKPQGAVLGAGPEALTSPSVQPDVADAKGGQSGKPQAGNGREGFSGRSEALADAEGKPGEIREAPAERQGGFASGGNVPDADGSGRQGRSRFFREERRPEPTNGNWWTVESGVGKLAYGISDRVGKLKCLGNAVVPQIAEWLGKRIKAVANELP